MNNKRYAEVLEQLSALRSGSFKGLLFSPDLEERYQLSQNDWYRESIRVSALVAITLLLASYLVELGTGLGPAWYGMVARSVAILGLLLAYIYIQRSINLTWKYWVVSLNAMLVVGALLVVAAFTPAPVKLIYYSNVFFVEVVVFTFIRLPLNFTNTLGLVMLLMVGGALYLDTMNLQLTSHVMFFLITGTIIAVMVSTKTEKMSRESFLKSELIHFEKNHLRALNEQLNEQISMDRITHLLNRIAFEDRLLSGWQIASQNGRDLSMVAINIQHFAHFNECNGNEAGDDLLREVARRIRKVMDGVIAEISRLSGGRFLIMVDDPNANIDAILETLRAKLERLSTLESSNPLERSVYLAWGRVNLNAESERDPRGLIDRMFNHLVPMEGEDSHRSCCVLNRHLGSA